MNCRSVACSAASGIMFRKPICYSSMSWCFARSIDNNSLSLLVFPQTGDARMLTQSFRRQEQAGRTQQSILSNVSYYCFASTHTGNFRLRQWSSNDYVDVVSQNAVSPWARRQPQIQFLSTQINCSFAKHVHPLSIEI